MTRPLLWTRETDNPEAEGPPHVSTGTGLDEPLLPDGEEKEPL